MSAVIVSLKNNADAAFGTAVLFMILTGVALGARIVLRPLLHIKLGIEDWFLFAAAIFFWVLTALNFKAISVGRRAQGPSDPLLIDFFKYIYLAGVFYFPAVCCVNISILCLYRRLFSTERFRRISLAVIIFNVCWFIPSQLVEIFACLPVPHFWDPYVPGTCVWYSTFWLALGVVELVTDVILLVLPLREISKLQLSTQNKLKLSFLFALGGLSIITGILRLVLGYQGPKNSYINLVQDAIWIHAHVGLTIICACLPTFRPLFTKGATMLSSMRHKYGSSGSKSEKPTKTQSPASTDYNSDGRYQNLADDTHSTQLSTLANNSDGDQGV